jgi:PAS domain S-box-containing protein
VWWLIASGRFTLGIRLFIVGVLGIVLAETYVIPDELVTWVIAAFLPFGLALQFTFGRTPVIAGAAGLMVAINALVIRAGLHFTSGFPANLLGWLDVAGGVIVLVALALLLIQIRAMSEARALRLLQQQQLAGGRAAELQAIVAASPDAVIGLDIEGVVTAWNPRAEAIFGWTSEEIVGQRLVDRAVPPEYREAHSQGLKTFRETGAAPVLDKLLNTLSGIRKDGTQFPIELVISKQPTETGQTGFVGFVRDITERKHLEQQLQQAQRLESLGQLAGGVAHDFNNLLGVILNYASFVKEQVATAAQGTDGDRWRAVREDIDQVQLAADRAAGLTRQLLAFARRDVAQPQVLDINGVVSGLEPMLQRTLGEHVHLVVSLAADPWPVLIDPGQLEQTLVNLAINARDAMPAGGGLTIDTQNTEVDAAFAATRPDLATGRYVRLRVSDTGTGMDEAIAQQAFEPFFTTKPKGEGTGLGLATVYGVITQAGGRVQIYSEPGQGTTITVLLPATEATATALKTEIPAIQLSGTETVLMVEDEAALLEVTKRLLLRNGYTVLSASGGAAAIKIAQEHDGRIDILITDVIMPEMMGPEVAQQVVRLRPDIRVLYISGYAQPVLGHQGTLDPGLALVEKPFTEAELLTSVRQVLQQP